MTEPIVEQQEKHDTDIQEIAAVITGILQDAFDALIRRRERAYADAIRQLDREADEIRQEHRAIGEAASALEELLPATARVLRYEADLLLVAGKADEAKAKVREQQQAEAAPQRMRQRQANIIARLEVIEEQKRTAARHVFGQWYAEVQQVVRAAERGLFVTLLDGLHNDFWSFQAATDTGPTAPGDPGLFNVGHIANLTAPERSAEWQAGQRWYRGRR